MYKSTFFGAALGSLWLAGCFAGRPATFRQDAELPGARLFYTGRYRLSGDSAAELISSGVHTTFSFNGSACTVQAAAAPGAHSYLQYELDGQYQGRVRVEAGGTAISINATVPGRHTVRLFKATEAHSGPLYLRRISGSGVRAQPVPDAPLIEFIGNSITCGAAADPSEYPCGSGAYHDQHNAYLAYGPRAARALGGEFVLSSVSGIGIYRTWNREGPSMPQVYEQTDFQPGGTDRWDFSRFRPRVIAVALGTNDFSNGDGVQARAPFDSVRFVEEYVRFVHRVKALQPAARLLLLSSPMVQGERGRLLERCLARVKERVDKAHPGAYPVALFFFSPFQARGCTGHPDVEDHARMAEEVTPALKALLGK
ncbi:MAG TPA: GDSL-type esterase/lipase family protein [Chitinophagaceae bacterium]|jgi:lysophospholipase L1-like esterase|nr:GDSL-type esterase/lipase family protein [Chitinophagaceae bacterium]